MRVQGDFGLRLEPALHARALVSNLVMHDGIVAPRVSPYLTHPYEAKAIVPSPTVRPLYSRELEQLLAPSVGKGDVCLVRMPEHLRNASRAVFRELNDCSDEGEFHSRLEDASLDMLAEVLAEAVTGWARLNTAFRYRISRAGLPTVTERDDRLIGLHLDSWYRDSPFRRHPPARLCLNLGVQTRAFLCVCAPLALPQHSFDGDDTSPLEGTGLARQRFARHCGPVLRLRVPPGWGYIAPTERLVHDGSTDGMSAWDVVAHVHGWFDLGAMPDAWRAQ